MDELARMQWEETLDEVMDEELVSGTDLMTGTDLMKGDKKMEIKTLVRNMRDELERAESALNWLHTKHPEIYSEIQNGELGDVLTQDIRDELDRTEDLLERIDFAMLMSAEIGDVALPTIEDIYTLESQTELPYDDGFVDTETVYNTLGEITSELKEKVRLLP